MRAENYIAFFTVSGFFVGIVWTLFKAYSPVDMLIYTILITFFFYLVIHIVIMNYVDLKSTVKRFFDKQKHEEVIDYLLGELAIREKRMENLIIRPDQKPPQAKKVVKKNGQVKAKAA